METTNTETNTKIESKQNSNSEDKRMTFLEHLEELRYRILFSLIGIIIGGTIAWFFSERIQEFLLAPVIKVMPKGSQLILLNPAEGFIIRLKIAIISGIIIASPVIFSQIWLFVSPGLYAKEKKVIIPFTFFASFFFIGGASFSYFVILPIALRFFSGFTTQMVANQWRLESCINFITSFLLSFGVVFEIPLIIFFLSWIGILNPQILKQRRNYAILIILILAAATTPSPDIFSQIALAIPLLVLYEISILGSSLAYRRNKNN